MMLLPSWSLRRSQQRRAKELGDELKKSEPTMVLPDGAIVTAKAHRDALNQPTE